jgi:hypothetical protein
MASGIWELIKDKLKSINFKLSVQLDRHFEPRSNNLQYQSVSRGEKPHTNSHQPHKRSNNFFMIYFCRQF